MFMGLNGGLFVFNEGVKLPFSVNSLKKKHPVINVDV